jgi:predicted nucleotidyltransferase
VVLVTRRCSVHARGDNRADSDIDIMLEFDPAARVTVFTMPD